MEPNRKILIVEDNWVIAQDTQKSLENLGFDVCGVVPCGEEAIEAVEKILPDLILMDINLSGPLDGIDTAMQIAQNHAVPVIYVTAFADKDLAQRVKLTGPYGYITKPFKEADLHTSIEIALFKHEMEKQLRESEEKHRLMFESANDGIFIHGMQGKILNVNPMTCKLLGYTHEELISMTVGQVDTPEEALHVPDRTAQVMKQGHLTFETVHQHKDGSRIPMDVSTRLITWEGQQAVMSFCRDISERKRIEADRDKLILELQQALDRVKTLSGLLPICSYCKKIRDDKGYWNQIETYIMEHSDAQLSHGICQECAKKYYPDMNLYDD